MTPRKGVPFAYTLPRRTSSTGEENARLAFAITLIAKRKSGAAKFFDFKPIDLISY